MRKICVLFVLAMVLSGCGLTKKDLGMARSTPDENQVSRREKLVVPPDYTVRP